MPVVHWNVVHITFIPSSSCNTHRSSWNHLNSMSAPCRSWLKLHSWTTCSLRHLLMALITENTICELLTQCLRRVISLCNGLETHTVFFPLKLLFFALSALYIWSVKCFHCLEVSSRQRDGDWNWHWKSVYGALALCFSHCVYITALGTMGHCVLAIQSSVVR